MNEITLATNGLNSFQKGFHLILLPKTPNVGKTLSDLKEVFWHLAKQIMLHLLLSKLLATVTRAT